MRTTRAAAALIGLTLAVTACASGDAEPATGADVPAETQAPAPVTAPAPAEPTPGASDEPAVVPAALQFSASLVGGGELDAEALAGKPTVFWFWAPT